MSEDAPRTEQYHGEHAEPSEPREYDASAELRHWREVAETHARWSDYFKQKCDRLVAQLDDARTIETSLRAEIAQLRAERAPVEPTPAPAATGYVMLKYGTLPTASMLHIHAPGVPANDVRETLRGLIRHERHDDARRLLNGLGFDWLPLAGCTCGGSPCICADVAAVDDATRGIGTGPSADDDLALQLVVREVGSIDDTLTARAAIVAKIGKWTRGMGASAGQISCPVCKSGALHFNRSGYNGHIHGACSTPSCVRWME